MDIALAFIEQLTNRVGIPVAIAVVFIWLVIRAYNFWETKVDSHLTKQTEIMNKLVDTVEASAEATKTTVLVLDRICTMTTHIESLATSDGKTLLGDDSDAHT